MLSKSQSIYIVAGCDCTVYPCSLVQAYRSPTLIATNVTRAVSCARDHAVHNANAALDPMKCNITCKLPAVKYEVTQNRAQSAYLVVFVHRNCRFLRFMINRFDICHSNSAIVFGRCTLLPSEKCT